MNVKIDTKEKFTVITPDETALPANMTAEMSDLMLSYLSKETPHIVLKMNMVQSADPEVLDMIAGVQQQFYQENHSFVICELQEPVKQLLMEKDLLDTMNVTPTESEAWDILQMEEIERDLMDWED